MPRPLFAVWLAARPKTLLLALSPVLLGTAVAAHARDWQLWIGIACALGAAAIQVGTNLINDWADAARGADDDARIGPMRMTSSGLLTPQRVLTLGLAAFFVAILLGIALVVRGGWPVVLVGLSGLVAGFCYTGGPYPLAYHGFGEVFAFAYFGPVAVVTTAYLHTGGVPAGSWALGVSMGALAAVVLGLNNLRDRVGDARVHKRTLAVRYGDRPARILLALSVVVAFGVLAMALWQGTLPGTCAVAGLALAPATWLLWGIATREGAAINALLPATAALQAVLAALLSWPLFAQR